MLFIAGPYLIWLFTPTNEQFTLSLWGPTPYNPVLCLRVAGVSHSLPAGSARMLIKHTSNIHTTATRIISWNGGLIGPVFSGFRKVSPYIGGMVPT